jgi:hypothetical protein
VQQEGNVGVNEDSFMLLADANALFPYQTRVAWEEAGSKGGGLAAASLKCDADPPPATLVLSGELKNSPSAWARTRWLLCARRTGVRCGDTSVETVS